MYQESDYVITTRLHGAIIAYAFKRPYIAISFDPKVAAFNKLYGGGVCITSINELKAALSNDSFKAPGEYEKEIKRVKNFGVLVAAAIKTSN
jgi:polysaccharide pyruvyl transferase WcaK-like protein